jgi:hypothetical protein
MIAACACELLPSEDRWEPWPSLWRLQPWQQRLEVLLVLQALTALREQPLALATEQPVQLRTVLQVAAQLVLLGCRVFRP